MIFPLDILRIQAASTDHGFTHVLLETTSQQGGIWQRLGSIVPREIDEHLPKRRNKLPIVDDR